MAKAVFCIAKSEEQATQIVNQLKEAGFSNDDVSVLLPDRAGSRDFAHEHHTKAPEGAATGAVVGGITAGIAAPAAVGIPVTHRDHTMGVVFVTGHGASRESGALEPDWRALVATKMTLVVYMGVRRLADITNALVNAGLDPETPCAAIERATRPDQRHLRAPLRHLAQAVEHAGIGAPAIVVIGSVAGLGIASALDYVTRQP